MMSDLVRTQLLLKVDQHKALTVLAKTRGSSISEVTRDIIGDYLTSQDKKRKHEALQVIDKARALRKSLRKKRGGRPLDLDVVGLLRNLREERTDALLKSSGGR
jgi:hypothetical protein